MTPDTLFALLCEKMNPRERAKLAREHSSLAEISFPARDFLAIMDGAMLIKPNTFEITADRTVFVFRFAEKVPE